VLEWAETEMDWIWAGNQSPNFLNIQRHGPIPIPIKLAYFRPQFIWSDTTFKGAVSPVKISMLVEPLDSPWFFFYIHCNTFLIFSLWAPLFWKAFQVFTSLELKVLQNNHFDWQTGFHCANRYLKLRTRGNLGLYARLYTALWRANQSLNIAISQTVA